MNQEEAKWLAEVDSVIDGCFDRLRALGVDTGRVFMCSTRGEDEFSRTIGFGSYAAQLGMTELWRKSQYAREAAFTIRKDEQE